MMKRIYMLVFVIIHSFTGISQNTERGIEQVILDNVYCDSIANIIVVKDSTIEIDIQLYKWHIKELLDTFQKIDTSKMFNEFKETNKHRTKVNCNDMRIPNCRVNCGYINFSSHDYNWQSIYDSIPHFSTYASLSNPFFFRHNDKLFMIIYYESSSGSLVGGARFYLYLVGNQKIKQLNSVLVWVS